MLPAISRRYLLNALEGTPDVVERLLKNLALANPIWDFRPDAARFTAREIVAHLADWEVVVGERARRTLIENEPLLPSWDETQAAVEGDYARADPNESLRRFRNGRAATLSILNQIAEDDWQRVAFREGIGEMSLEGQVVLAAGHDGYHTRQIAQWLEAWENWNTR